MQLIIDHASALCVLGALGIGDWIASEHFRKVGAFTRHTEASSLATYLASSHTIKLYESCVVVAARHSYDLCRILTPMLTFSAPSPLSKATVFRRRKFQNADNEGKTPC